MALAPDPSWALALISDPSRLHIMALRPSQTLALARDGSGDNICAIDRLGCGGIGAGDGSCNIVLARWPVQLLAMRDPGLAKAAVACGLPLFELTQQYDFYLPLKVVIL